MSEGLIPNPSTNLYLIIPSPLYARLCECPSGAGHTGAITMAPGRVSSSIPFSLSIPQRTDHAPGPGTEPEVPFVQAVPVVFPVHHNAISRAFVKTIGRLGRWKRVLNSRQTERGVVLTCLFDPQPSSGDELGGNRMGYYAKKNRPPYTDAPIPSGLVEASPTVLTVGPAPPPVQRIRQSSNVTPLYHATFHVLCLISNGITFPRR